MHPIRVSGRWTRGHVLGVLGALVAAVGLLAGCGGSSKKSSSSSTLLVVRRADELVDQRADPGDDHVVDQHDRGPGRGRRGWTQPNGNLAGTRDVTSSINSSNVNKLGVAWKVPITGKPASFGNFAATPVDRRRSRLLPGPGLGRVGDQDEHRQAALEHQDELAERRSGRRQRRRRQGLRRDQLQCVRAERRDRRAAVVQEADPQRHRGHRHGPRRQQRHRLRLDRAGQRRQRLLRRQRRRRAVGDGRGHRQGEVEVERSPHQPVGQQEGQLRRRPVAATDVRRRRPPVPRGRQPGAVRRRQVLHGQEGLRRTGPAPRHEPLHRHGRRAQPGHRQDHVALPADAARHPRLGPQQPGADQHGQRQGGDHLRRQGRDRDRQRRPDRQAAVEDPDRRAQRPRQRRHPDEHAGRARRSRTRRTPRCPASSAASRRRTRPTARPPTSRSTTSGC